MGVQGVPDTDDRTLVVA